MSDLASLSDEELEHIASGNAFSPAGVRSDLDSLSDDELQKIASGEAFGKNAEERPWYAFDVKNVPAGFVAGLKKIDEYTGAPVRKFVTELATGEQLDSAPSGADQAKRMGATDVSYGDYFGIPDWVPGRNISPADIYGVGLEMVQDPTVAVTGAFNELKHAGKFSKGARVAEEASPIAKQAMRATQEQAANISSESAAKSAANISGGALEVEQSGKLFDIKRPKSLEELRQWSPAAGQGELLGKSRLQEIEGIVPDLQTKPLNYHYSMMENPKAMKEMKIQFENLPTNDAKKIASYNQEMVEESGRKVLETVNGITKNEPKALTDAGENLIGKVKEAYHAEKKELSPMFEELKRGSDRLTEDESRDLIVAIGENSKLGQLIGQDEAGKLILNKNTPRTGISDAEHQVLSRVIEDLNHGMTFEELQKTREFLRKAIDPRNPGAADEIGKVRSIMLGQMEEMAAKRGPRVGDTFKRYAKNERARENIESVIGGKIESLDRIYAANPDKVVQKVFSNPNYAKVVEEYVGKDVMDEMVQSYIGNGVKGAYDSAKGFQPEKLRTWLKSNDRFLSAYADPGLVKRLNALADYGYYGKRFLDEVNPSGTAASLAAMLEPKNLVQRIKTEGVRGAVTSAVTNKVTGSLSQRQAMKSFNKVIGDVKAPAPKSSTITSAFRDVTDSVSKSAEKTAATQGAASYLRLSHEGKIPRSGIEQNDENVKEPTKGPEKWANDGAKKLKSHGLKDQSLLDRAMQSKKGRELLIRASDLSPGSKAMDRIFSQLKTDFKGGV